jgi:hypothetical protein
MEEKTQITDEMVRAAEDIYNFLFNKLNTDTGIHIGTFVASAARLAGTSLFRSFNLDLSNDKPGTCVLSENANIEGPKLINILLGALNVMGIKVNQNKSHKTPKEQLPKLTINQIQSTFQSEYNKIMTKYKLDYFKAAFSGAFACAIIINETKKQLNPNISMGIAIMGFIEGSKTIPMPLIKD